MHFKKKSKHWKILRVLLPKPASTITENTDSDRVNMCANTCTHSQAGGEVERERVLPCQLIVTPSAVTQTHSSGDSQRTSSALTDTFQHWHAVRKPTWSLSLPPYVLEANCPRWSWTWKQNNFYLFQMWLKSCPYSFFSPQWMSQACVSVGLRLFSLEVCWQCRMTD